MPSPVRAAAGAGRTGKGRPARRAAAVPTAPAPASAGSPPTDSARAFRVVGREDDVTVSRLERQDRGGTVSDRASMNGRLRSPGGGDRAAVAPPGIPPIGSQVIRPGCCRCTQSSSFFSIQRDQRLPSMASRSPRTTR